MTVPRETPATTPATPADPRPAKAASDGKPLSNSERWDAEEEPWRHLPVAPKDESPIESFGRSVSNAIVGAVDKDAKVSPTPKPQHES